MRTPSPAPSDTSRSNWLAELADSLAQCDRLLAELQMEHPPGIDTTILTARVAALRSEIAKLERGIADDEAIDPISTDFFSSGGQTPCGKSPPPPNSLM